VQAGVLRLLDGLRRARGLSVILITHDLGVMSAVADELAVFYGGRIVEAGPTPALLSAPRHPYTRALLEALPHPERDRGTALRGIPGPPAQPGDLPSGCAFHPRCEYAIDSCRVHRPELVHVGNQAFACPVDPFAP
jgi:oligopeptide/dipeptide ABC transporter ATP-binding protein